MVLLKCFLCWHITAWYLESPSWLCLLVLFLNVGAPQTLAYRSAGDFILSHGFDDHLHVRDDPNPHFYIRTALRYTIISNYWTFFTWISYSHQCPYVQNQMPIISLQFSLSCNPHCSEVGAQDTIWEFTLVNTTIAISFTFTSWTSLLSFLFALFSLYVWVQALL